MSFSNTRYLPIIFLVSLDLFVVFFSVYFSAVSIEYNFIPILDLFLFYSAFLFVIVFLINYLLKNYSYLNRSFGIENIKNLLIAAIIIFLSIYSIKITLEILGIKLFFFDNYFFSFNNIINQVVLISFFSISFRFLINRFANYIIYKKKLAKKKEASIVLYGAGNAGLSFLENIKINDLVKPIYLIDDDTSKIGRYVNDIKIISYGEFRSIIKQKKTKIDQVILTIPSLDTIKKDKIEKKINNLGLQFETQNSFVNNFSKLSNILKNISDKSQNIEENLSSNEKNFFKNKVVMVTGAGGSIGREICYKISKLKIKKLITLEIDEYRLSILNREIRSNKNLKKKYIDYLIDTNNLKLTDKIFKNHKPDLVFHAAASKHVDLVERNWFQSSLNNIKTTYNVCKLAFKYSVKKVIFISTDKAVDPINFLGFSKSVGEKIFLIFGAKNKNTSFSIVRFGNVVGSSGSLLDTIKHQLDLSNEIILTDKRMTRYFMTISDAVNLVLISSKISQNSNCHVLKMGKPVKIIDIIKNIIKENPSKAKIRVVGRRPGEKLHEKLFDTKNVEKTDHKYILNEKQNVNLKQSDIDNLVRQLEDCISNKNKFKKLLKKFIN